MTQRLVRVLVTGFGPFPLNPRHPSWIKNGVEPEKRITPPNPSEYVARNMELDAEAGGIDDVEIHRLFPLPVEYAAAGELVLRKINELNPDLFIGFGLGAKAREEGLDPVDAELELSAINLRHDDKGTPEQGERIRRTFPSQWPPDGDPDTWSEQDRAWIERFPDNADVSCTRERIVPGGERILFTDIRIQEIIDGMKDLEVNGKRVETLFDSDPEGSTGRFICNEVYYTALSEQKKRKGAKALFVHLPPLHDDRKQRMLKAAEMILAGCLKQLGAQA